MLTALISPTHKSTRTTKTKIVFGADSPPVSATFNVLPKHMLMNDVGNEEKSTAHGIPNRTSIMNSNIIGGDISRDAE